MSDEEIIKTLKFAIAQDEVECIGYWDEKYRWVECSMKDVFDVIQRLQAEKEELKQTKFGNWKVKFFKAQEEIERLTERETFLENAWKTSLESTQTVEIALKANRAREEELQKQVDELKDICLDCPYKLKFDEIEKQAVKDTATKYHDAVKELFNKQDCCGCVEDRRVEEWHEDNDRIAKEYGVEVE